MASKQTKLKPWCSQKTPTNTETTTSAEMPSNQHRQRYPETYLTSTNNSKPKSKAKKISTWISILHSLCWFQTSKVWKKLNLNQAIIMIEMKMQLLKRSKMRLWERVLDSHWQRRKLMKLPRGFLTTIHSDIFAWHSSFPCSDYAALSVRPSSRLEVTQILQEDSFLKTSWSTSNFKTKSLTKTWQSSSRSTMELTQLMTQPSYWSSN